MAFLVKQESTKDPRAGPICGHLLADMRGITLPGGFDRAGPMDPAQHDAPWCVGAGDRGKGECGLRL